MTAHVPDRIGVRATEDHVEVVGLSKEDVEYAISLFQAVAQEQTEARSALASHVNQAMLHEGIELIPAASQRQVQRSAALKKRLIEDQGFETYASLAEIRDTRESSVRTWVSRLRRRSDLFTVEFQGHTLIPKLQLTDSGDVNPVVAELVRPLAGAGLDSWSLWAWLTNPTGLLSGEIPAEVAVGNITRATKAANRYAAELRQAQANVA
jgi:hypothetical protein